MAIKKYYHDVELTTGHKLLDSEGNDITITKDVKAGLDGAEGGTITASNPVITKTQYDADMTAVTGKFKAISLTNATGTITVTHGLNNQNIMVQAVAAGAPIDISWVPNTTTPDKKIDIDFGTDTIASVTVFFIGMPAPTANPTT